MSVDEVEAFRVLTGITEEDLSDDDLSDIYDAADSSIHRSAAIYYERQAKEFSTLVDVSESGSSRSLGNLYKNATELSKYWNNKADAASGTNSRVARTRATVRES